MNVSQLIELLKQHNPDERVVISGYEGGYNDVKETEEIKVILDYNKDTWYYGSHEEISSIYGEDKKKDPVKVILID